MKINNFKKTQFFLYLFKHQLDQNTSKRYDTVALNFGKVQIQQEFGLN